MPGKCHTYYSKIILQVYIISDKTTSLPDAVGQSVCPESGRLGVRFPAVTDVSRLIWRRHHQLWKATNFDTRHSAIEQWEFLNRHAYCITGQPFIIVISENPWHLHLLPSVWLYERLMSVSTATTANLNVPTLYMYHYATAAVKVEVGCQGTDAIVLNWIRDIYCITQSQVSVCDYNHCLIFLLDFHWILSRDSTFLSVLFATFCHFQLFLELLTCKSFNSALFSFYWSTFLNYILIHNF